MEDMEIDAFAQKMLERTQARRDMINKKLPNSDQSSKTRIPLASTEDNAIPANLASKKDNEDSLKRKSSDAESNVLLAKRRSIEVPKDLLDKENDADNEPTVIRGLAALRKKTTDEIAGCMSSQSNSLKVTQEITKPDLPSSPRVTHARSRLAALASDINKWEDDSSNSSKIPTERFKHENTTTIPKEQKPANTIAPKSPVKITTSESEFTKPSSPAKSTKTLSPAKPACKTLISPGKHKVMDSKPAVKVEREGPAKTEKVRKNYFWDEKVISTLEAQGFTKSVSASKLSYKYEKTTSESLIRDRLKMFENQTLSEIPKKSATLPRKFNAPVAATTKSIEISKSPKKIENPTPKPNPPVIAVPPSPVKPLETKLKNPVNVEPSNLPLSARKAMFETPVSKAPSVFATPELLSVSQRAALFEKAMTLPASENTPKVTLAKSVSSSNIMPKIDLATLLNTPQLENVPLFQSSINVGILKAGGKPVEEAPPKKIVHFSPTKNVESHTAQLQQNLMQKVNNTSNDIASKMIEERKKELEELKNRWNRTPKKAFNPFGGNQSDETAVSKSNKDSVMETELSYVVSTPIPPPPPMSSEEATPKQCLTPQCSFTAETKLVCEKFDEMLDVLNEFSSSEEESESPRLYPSLSKLKKIENSPTKMNLSPPKSARYVEDKPEGTPNVRYIEEESLVESESVSEESVQEETTLSPGSIYPSLPSTSTAMDSPTKSCSPTTSPTKPAYINPISQESESPELCHSISLYRRLNKSNNNTPVKVVKRNIEIDLSPARQEDSEFFEEVQYRIKQLQEDLHRQDVQVKQACQALFLCAAKPEFFGSTEHVEGERLLLITTHKRNSCKNAIEQLKTEAALGFNPSGERGTLSISEIRLPLKQEFLTAKMGGHMSDAVHYFFCLIRYREKVIATEMLNTKDGITAGTFSFSNHICLQELRSNFSILFEVYALQTNAQNVPHDLKYNIRKDHSKLKITPKHKKLDAKAKASPALSNIEPRERSSNFDVVGSIRLNIDNCRRRILALEKVPTSSPLDGRSSMKLKLCTEQPIKEKGFLTMFEDVSGFGNWYRRWFVLSGNYVSYWKYPDNEKTETPMGTVDLRQCITPEVGLINPNVCVRKHTFSLLNVRPKTKQDQDTLVSQSHNTYTTTEYRLSADTKEERILWCTRLNQALDIIRKWDPEALRPIQLNETRA